MLQLLYEFINYTTTHAITHLMIFLPHIPA